MLYVCMCVFVVCVHVCDVSVCVSYGKATMVMITYHSYDRSSSLVARLCQ